MIRQSLAALALVLAAITVIVTLLPLSASNAWWVRMWEFPRLHIAVASVAIAVLAATLPHGVRGAVILAMLTTAVWQSTWVWPYAPWAREDVALVPGEGTSLVALNVLQGNEDHAAVRAFLEEVDPDILLLMETDDVWADALEPFLARYPSRVEHLTDDFYGMILATRLEAEEMELVTLSDDITPTAMARLSVEGRPFTLIGLHPRPPVPDTATEERDEQIATAALLARRDGVPTIAAGDFNDVAWSRASQRFRDIGGYRDPRVGRGILASFDAERPILRFPIDQGLITDGIELHDFVLGPNVGSDHFPVVLNFSVGGDEEAAADR